MADVFGYYDTNRGLLGDALAMDPKYKVNDPTPAASAPAPANYWGYTPSSIVNSATGGMIGAGISNPNEPGGGWYATNLGGNGQMRPVSGEEYRLLTDSTHSNRDLLQAAAKVAALIYGGAALSGVGAGGTAASGIGNAGLGFGGSATGAGAVAGDGLSEVTTGASYLPGGTEGFLGAPASEGLAAFPSAGGGSSLLNGGFGLEAGAGGAPAAGSLSESVAGTPFQASGEYGAVSGTPGAIPAAAAQASGEYVAPSSWLDKLNQLSKMGGGSPQGQAQSPQFSAPLMPQRSGGGFLQQLVKPRPNYLGRFGDAVMASQSANDLLLKSKLFGRERQ